MRPQGDNGAMDSGGCCCARPRVQQQARPEKRSYPRGLWRGVFRHAPFFVALKVAPAFVSVSEDVVYSAAFCFLFWDSCFIAPRAPLSRGAVSRVARNSARGRVIHWLRDKIACRRSYFTAMYRQMYSLLVVASRQEADARDGLTRGGGSCTPGPQSGKSAGTTRDTRLRNSSTRHSPRRGESPHPCGERFRERSVPGPAESSCMRACAGILVCFSTLYIHLSLPSYQKSSVQISPE